MKAALRILVLVLGLALFGWFIHRAGPAEIWSTVRGLGWWAPLVLVPYVAVYAADTMGWRLAFGRRYPPGFRFWTLYRVRWCGEAVNNVVPSATIGGEATKVYLLHKRGVPGRDAAAAVIVGRTVQTLMQVVFIALGAAAFLQVSADRPGQRLAMGIVLALSVAAVAVLFWLQTHGLFNLTLRAAAWFRGPWARLQAQAERLRRIDRQVLEFYGREHRFFVGAAAAYLCGWLLDTLDIVVVAWLLGMPVAWTQALAIEAFIGVAKLFGFLVPGSLGVQESGITIVCRLAGLPDTFSLAYALIRRGRDLFFASVGWLMVYGEEATLRGLSRRVAAEAGTEL